MNTTVDAPTPLTSATEPPAGTALTGTTGLTGTTVLVCTTALCGRPAAARVSWRTQPQALPFCRECADRLAAHGDRVTPLPSAA